jgi:hypothetical protein
MQNIKETIQELEQRLKDYIQIISVRSIEHMPFFIVKVGALIIRTDNNGVVIVESKRYPMQFSEKAIKEIYSMTFRNCDNEIVQPKAFSRHEWYSEQIERLKMSIGELKKMWLYEILRK